MSETSDTTYALQAMSVFHALREPLLHAAISELQLQPGSHGLDAGCGVGLPALLLAEAVGSEGHVTGLDISSVFLEHAHEIAQAAGLADRVTFQKGDVRSIPFDNDTFDWAWSVDCVGYAPGDPLPPLKELARVVKPGGRLAILMYASQQLLPGYPLLEARLNATATGIAPFVEGMPPEWHHFRALGWLRSLGLRETTAHTFVSTVHAPLSGSIQDALIALFQMRWEGAQSEMTAEDWETYQSLYQPESPDSLLDRSGYYAFFTYSMFQGKVA